MSRTEGGTTPSVFIIESTTRKDEKKGRREGSAISEILNLINKKFEYHYFSSRVRLEPLLKEFVRSRFRYLHLACHGTEDRKGLAFRNDEISFPDLAAIVTPYLDKRRLFVSACAGVRKAFAVPLLEKSKCYSVIGPANDVDFADAALAWSSFYVLAFRCNERVMQSETIRQTLRDITSIFDVQFNAYFRKSKPPYYRYVSIPAKSTDL